MLFSCVRFFVNMFGNKLLHMPQDKDTFVECFVSGYQVLMVYFNIQVNPHTHQLKLCDFGSAKMLVSVYVVPLDIEEFIKLSGFSWIPFL